MILWVQWITWLCFMVETMATAMCVSVFAKLNGLLLAVVLKTLPGDAKFFCIGMRIKVSSPLFKVLKRAK